MNDWHAAVIVLRQPDGRVLSVTRGDDLDDVNLPGGHRKWRDRSPAETARRELQEETGLLAQELRPLAAWSHQGRRVVAFQGLGWSGRLRPSPEGHPAWVRPEELRGPGSRFRRENGMLLSRL
jgi:8-oxo-dGTP pyrophosphatase MutT (NUDIX family)